MIVTITQCHCRVRKETNGHSYRFFPSFLPSLFFPSLSLETSLAMLLPLSTSLFALTSLRSSPSLVVVPPSLLHWHARTHARAFVIECRCRFIFYCGKDCQKRDWKLHKNECLRIGNMDPSLVPKLVNQFTRLVARAIDLDQMGESQKESNFYKVDGELGI